jgi:pyruvate dehydrogenase E2 component (dihydrolipoamide acetyltransferase)
LMTCTLSADHRVIDGALAAQFLAAFKRRVEAPLAMLL